MRRRSAHRIRRDVYRVADGLSYIEVVSGRRRRSGSTGIARRVRIGTDSEVVRAWPTTRSTTSGMRLRGMAAARTWRSASERTFHGVHDDRSASIAVSTCWAVWLIHASSTTGGATLGWLHTA
jgi:hypothetical protein